MDAADLYKDRRATIDAFDNCTEVSIPNELYADATRLKQVLINLIKNALKFTRNGKIKILFAFDQAKSQLVIKIVDTGKGFAEKEGKNLFKMFGKLKGTAEMNVDGIGLGLMICKQLIEFNGGQISLKSEGIDMGATVSFTFRATMEDSEQDESESEQEIDILCDKSLNCGQ